MEKINFYEAVYRVVKAIPHGRVATYGTIATWLGAPRAARAVGYALAADIESDVPWHRVVNRLGGISEGGAPWRPTEQRRRLEAEKLHFSPQGTLDLTKVGFSPSPRQYRVWLALGDAVVASR